MYVHVPFCRRKCPYCHFYNLGHDGAREEMFLTGMEREIGRWRAKGVFRKARLETLYWGGGTPSILEGEALDRLADMCLSIAPKSERFEWTIEVNPADGDVRRFGDYRERGVNRLSIGVQSFQPSRLAFLERDHTPEQGRSAVLAATRAGFEDISIDLMFNLEVPHRRREWVDDLDRAFRLPITHLSLYGLTLEPGTVFGARKIAGERLTVTEPAYAAEYRAACRMARRAGFEHYEVSSFARSDHQARHNSAYWSGALYLGLGPSAHSFDGCRRWANIASLRGWAKRLAKGDDPHDFVEVLGPRERELERLYLGLRTDHGVAGDHPALSSVVGAATVGELVRRRMLVSEGGRVRCTDRGFLVLDAILERFAASMEPPRSPSAARRS